MPISISRYVDITSGVGASVQVPTRDLIGRFFSGSLMIPPDSFYQFDNADDVGNLFGFTSEEYARSVFYFSFVSKNITTPPFIQFARWVNVSVAPMIFSVYNNNTTLSAWTGITAGVLTLTIGEITYKASGMDFSGAATLDAVAVILTTAINSGPNVDFTNSEVLYNGNGGFTFTGGAVVAETISVTSSAGVDVSGMGLLGWLPAATNLNGIFVPGGLAIPGALSEGITTVLTNSAANNNNFGSFLFLNNVLLTLPGAILAAQWNVAANNTYLFCAPVTSSNASAWANDVTGLGSLGGTALTLSGYTLAITGTVTNTSATISNLASVTGLQIGNPVSGTNIPTGAYIISINAATNSVVISAAATGTASEVITFTPAQFPEQIPMMIEASTNYDMANSVQNYMFQGPFSSLTPLVTNDTNANLYDALSVNYYGSTQTAGQPISFYQTGVLQGVSPSPLDMTAYINEIWLKDAALAAIMNLLVTLTQIPANQQGRSQILSALQTVITQALLNGTISINKTLTNNQQIFITGITNDPLAWYQVQSLGYWVDVQIVASNTNPVIYSAAYTLVYSKDDVIRFVSGQDILI